MSRLLLIAVLAVLAALPATAAAQQQVLGSSLASAPNWGAGCELELDFFDEGPTARGEYSARRTNKDCTWFTPASVPGNGRITRVSVRAGTGAARVRFVVVRSLQGQGGPAGGGCCFFVAEFPPAPEPALTLTPNTVNTFTTDIPVERNTSERTGIVTADFLGISAEPNTGELPLFDSDPGANSTLAGPTTAAFYYPRLGAMPGDASSSRNPKGIPAVEVLLQSAFAPAGTPGGGTGGANPPPPNPGGGPGPGTPPPAAPGTAPPPADGGTTTPPPPAPAPAAAQAAAPALVSRALRVERGRALVGLTCRGTAPCAGRVTLRSRAARGARTGRSRTTTYGSARYAIRAGATRRLAVRLNARGRRLLRTRTTVRLALTVAPGGGARAVTSTVTVRAPRR